MLDIPVEEVLPKVRLYCLLTEVCKLISWGDGIYMLNFTDIGKLHESLIHNCL